MPTLIAIGGGEIGRPGTKVETLKIDKEIIKQTGKKNPKLLFIPTASNDSDGYITVVEKYFGKRLGCNIDTLLLTKAKYSKSALSKKVNSSDIVYVGGGNTLKMLKIWRRIGLDKILFNAYKKGIIMSGLSAGAICWFKYGNSDSRLFNNKKAKLIKVKGLGFNNLSLCPHYNVESDREESFKEMMKKTSGVGIALDNCSALFIKNDLLKIIVSNKNSFAYKIFWKNNVYSKIKLEVNKEYKLLEFLKT